MPPIATESVRRNEPTLGANSNGLVALDPGKLAQLLSEYVGEMALQGRRGGAQETDPGDLPSLLRPRRERPRRSAADQRDECAAVHSITSSARADSAGGTSRPNSFAVFRLITNSNLVACITGSSAGFSPLRIRAV